MTVLRKSVKYTLMAVGLLTLVGLVGLALMVKLFPQSSVGAWFTQMSEAPGSEDAPIPSSASEAFRNALQSEVRRTIGPSLEGYEPSMFLSVFPGLTETDFEGVEASIGHYTVKQGRIVHELDPTRLVHKGAAFITDGGIDTLLENVSKRLRVDLQSEGTITLIMRALVYEEGTEAVACTLEAKVCPDGSSVGRVGPSCEFAPCP